MLKYWKVLLVFIFIGLASTVYFQRNSIKELNNEIDRHKENAIGLFEENKTISLKQKELKQFIEDSESKFAKEIDSVTKANNIKVKHLNKIIQSKTTVTIRDTIYSEPKEVSKVDDSLYVLKFKRESDCISASVEAKTKDPFTVVRFTNISANNESYFIVYKKKKHWWQFFKKRKLMQKTVNRCGEVSIKELVIEKES